VGAQRPAMGRGVPFDLRKGWEPMPSTMLVQHLKSIWALLNWKSVVWMCVGLAYAYHCSVAVQCNPTSWQLQWQHVLTASVCWRWGVCKTDFQAPSRVCCTQCACMTLNVIGSSKWALQSKSGCMLERRSYCRVLAPERVSLCNRRVAIKMHN
jgi:hypothetical protein